MCYGSFGGTDKRVVRIKENDSGNVKFKFAVFCCAFGDSG